MSGQAGNVLTAANPVGMIANAPLFNPSDPSQPVRNLNSTGSPLNPPPADPTSTSSEGFGNSVLQSMSSILPGITQLISGGGKGGAKGAGQVLSAGMNQQPMQIPGVTPIEQQAGNTIQTNLTAGGNPAVLNEINQLTGGPVGSSPATQQAMKSFQDFTAPNIEQQMALSGLGRSQAAGQSVANASEQAMVPLMQTEIANREAAIPQLQTTGDTATSAAMGYGGLQRDIGTQQQQANQQAQQNQTSIAEQLLGIPMAGIGSAMAGMFTPRTTTGGKGK